MKSTLRSLSPLLPWALGLLLLVLTGWQAELWLARNGIPDGYQNEYLHVGNSLDLWQAWERGDRGLLSSLLRENYWPPGFYLAPWPLFALLGPGHRAMVLTNLGFLGALLAAVYGLARDLGERRTGLAAMVLVALSPGIYGNLVRYEPNLAVSAAVALGLLTLLRSRGFLERRYSLAFGLVCGLGLLLDRLSLGLFLALPALLLGLASLREGQGRRRLVNALLSLGLLALVAGWWQVEFLQHHLDEVLGQGGLGEIDSAGEWTEQRDALAWVSWLYYPLALLDSQAGLALGALGLAGLGAALWDRRARPVVVTVLLALGLFTLIQKKQAYYTLPLLGPFAVLAARLLGRRIWLLLPLVALLVVQQRVRLWGSGPAWLGQVIPTSWVSPRHPQSLPPRDLRLPVDELSAALPPGDITLFSQDHTWYEGFLVLQLRERHPQRRVLGLLSNPQGLYEWLGSAGSFIYVSELDNAPLWPSLEDMEDTLREHHYELDQLPPATRDLDEAREDFELVAWWPLEHGGRASLFRRVR